METRNMQTNQLKSKNITPILFTLFLFLNACAIPPGPVCTKNEIHYCKASGIFGGKWFDYYDRALSCMEGECYQAALSDLEQAITRRDQDERMAKTYGMHFTDYFPHREKGLIHYIENDYEKAKKELELSLQHEPTAKARFYLDKVRKSIMEQEKQPVSIPSLIVEFPSGIPGKSGEIWTKDDPITILGTAQDPQYVSEIILKEKSDGKLKIKPAFTGSSSQLVSFRQNLSLDQGRHMIRITAQNLLGGKTEQRLIINIDRAGPVIILEKFVPGSSVKGALYDESDEISLCINEKPAPLKKQKNIWFFESPLSPNTQSITLVAADKTGNQTQALINQDISAHTQYPLLTARNNQFAEIADTEPQFPVPKSQFSILTSHLRTVFLERTKIRGQVTSKNNITELTINNRPVLRHPGRIIFFSHPLKLKHGKNRFTIKAKDENNRETGKDIFITRKIPKPFQLKHRCRLAVYPFEYSDQVTNPQLIQYQFLKNMTDQKRFVVIVRDELQKILNESDFSIPSAQEAHKKPHAMLLGNIYKTRHGIEITAQFVDKTSEAHEFIDHYIPSDHPLKPEALGKKLSQELHRKFPLVDGTVTQITNNGLTVVPEKWIPGKGKIRMKWPVFAYRKENPAKTRGPDMEIIGETFVNRLATEDYGTAIVPGTSLGDGVITR